MPLTRPTYDVTNVQQLADLVQGQATLLKQTLDKTGAETKDFLIALLDELEEVADGASGADNIGMTPITVLGTQSTVQAVIEALVTRLQATADGASGADLIKTTAIEGITGNNVQAVLESLKQYVADNSPVLQGSIHDQFLGNDAGDLKQRFSEHLAETTQDYTVTLYVSPTGDNNNDGLSELTPFATLQKAFDTIDENAYRTNMGTWIVQLAAGMYNELNVTLKTPTKNRVIIKGPDVGGHPNIPTAIFDGTGGTNYDHGIRCSGMGVMAQVQDIKFQNFVGGNSRIGLVGENEADLYTKNIHAYNCDWCGIYASNTGNAKIEGGILDSCRSGFIANATEATIGYRATSLADGPIIKNCTQSGVYWSRGAQGHSDYCTYESNAIGLDVGENARIDAVGNNFKKNTTAVNTRSGGIFGDNAHSNIFNDGTSDANTKKFDYRAISGENQSILDFSHSEIRVALDTNAHVHTGTTSKTTVATLYTLPAYFLEQNRKIRVVAHGNYTVTTGTSIALELGGGTVTSLNVPGAATNAAFKCEFEIWGISNTSQRVSGALMQSMANPRLNHSSASIDVTTQKDLTLVATLAAAGDSLTINRIETFLMG